MDKEYYSSRIEEEIKTFYAQEGIEDIRKSPASVWSACMRHVCAKVIDREDITEHYSLNGAKMVQFDNEKLEMLLDIYLEQCERYDKIPTAWSYALMCGIAYSTIEEWCNDYRGLGVTSLRVEIVKKLSRAKECALEGRIQDGSRNPLGAIATLNRWYGWKEPEQIVDNPSRVRLDEIPNLASLLPVFDKEEKEV